MLVISSRQRERRRPRCKRRGSRIAGNDEGGSALSLWRMRLSRQPAGLVLTRLITSAAKWAWGRYPCAGAFCSAASRASVLWEGLPVHRGRDARRADV